MIFSVDFGAAQTGVGYQFVDAGGNLLGSRSTNVNAGALAGMYFVELTQPQNAVVIIWDCADPYLVARDDFRELARLESLVGEGPGPVQPPFVSVAVVGSLAQELDGDLIEAIRSYEQSFIWNGRQISAVINFRISRLITAKSFFGPPGGARIYPKCGQIMMINNAKYQITRKGNAQIKAVAGGFIEDPAFIDDPTNPELEIEYQHFVTR